MITPTNPLPCGCRVQQPAVGCKGCAAAYVVHCALHAAAGETLQDRDRLAARVAALEAALRPLASIRGTWLGGYFINHAKDADVQRAAALLAETSETKP